MLNGLREGERANCVRLSTICEATQAGSVSHTCPCGRLSENTDRALHLSHATPQEGPLRHLRTGRFRALLPSQGAAHLFLRSPQPAFTVVPWEMTDAWSAELREGDSVVEKINPGHEAEARSAKEPSPPEPAPATSPDGLGLCGVRTACSAITPFSSSLSVIYLHKVEVLCP